MNETSIELVLFPLCSYRFILSSGNHFQLQPELTKHIFTMCVKMKTEIDFITLILPLRCSISAFEMGIPLGPGPLPRQQMLRKVGVATCRRCNSSFPG